MKPDRIEATESSTTDEATAKGPPASAWDENLSRLRARFPQATEGIPFCIQKLQEDDSLTIPDFREEASLHGISLGGRALHSAKVLLGLATASPKRSKPEPRAHVRSATPSASSLEERLTDAVAELQNAATAESQRLREAIRKAIDILEDALEN